MLVAFSFAASPSNADLPRASGNWDPRFHGHGVVTNPWSIAVTDDRVYVAGDIRIAGDQNVDQLAVFDRKTEKWSPIPVPSDVAQIDRIAVFLDDLYIVALVHGGGPENHHLEVKRWDGETLTTLVSAPWRAYVTLLLQVTGDSLYVFGDFGAGDHHFDDIGRWDGEAWHNVPFDADGAISVAFHGDDVYILRYRYPDIAGIDVFDGINQTALDYPLSDFPGQIVFFHDELYLVGGFRDLGPDFARYIARWDGTQWRAVPGTPGPCSLAQVPEDGLYVVTGDTFHDQQIRRWDGSAWKVIGEFTRLGSTGPVIHQTSLQGGKLFVVGQFTGVNGIRAINAAYWEPDDSSWHGVRDPDGLGLDSPSHNVVAGTSGFYVSGNFSREHNIDEPLIGHWTGEGWEAVGDIRAAGAVHIGSLHVTDDGLIAIGSSGTSHHEGPDAAWHWNGSTWTPILFPAGLSIHGSTVAGGRFYVTAELDDSNPNRDRIFVWDGNDWTTLPSRTTGEVGPIAVTDNGDVIVSITPTTIENVAVAGIARWDGATWSSMGELDGYAASLATTGNAVFVGGIFQTVDGLPYAGLAKWEDGVWSAVGDLAGYTFDLEIDGSVLYALRHYQGEDETGLEFYVLRWDGRRWKVVGSAKPWVFRDIAANNGHVFATGDFIRIADRPSSYIAHWSACDFDVQSCMYSDGPCGDTDADDDIDTTDAMISLSAAVGLADCALLFCDVNSNGTLSVIDALAVLKATVGLPITLHCANPL